MPYNQACILISGCVGIGNDTPPSRLTIAPPANGTESTVEFTSTDNAVISSYYSQVFAVDNTNTQAGRTIQFAKGGKGYANQSKIIMTIDADTSRVGIGTASPTGELHICASQPALRLQSTVSGNMQLGQWDTVTNRIQSTGRDFLLTQTDACNILFNTNNTERMRISSTGNVGIGTTSPISKLHVEAGQIRMHGLPSDGITGCSGYYLANAPNSEAFQWQMSCNFNLSLWTYSATNGLEWGLRGPVITQTGNVGIGTTNPSYKLQVVTSGTAGVSIVTAGSNSANPSLQLLSDSTDSTISSTSNGLELTAYSAHALLLKTTNVERMRITATGNVGIGTTSPTIFGGGLEVARAGQAGIRVSSTGTNCGRVEIGSDDGLCRSYIQTIVPGGRLDFYTGCASVLAMTIACSGNVGIGITSPDQRLSVKSGTASTYNATAYSGANAPMLLVSSTCGTSDFSGIRFTNSNGSVEGLIAYVQTVGGAVNCADFVFQGFGNNSSYSEKMRITGAGNVGIGTASPIDKFEVAGGIHTSGTASASKACTGYLDYYLGSVRLGITGPNTTSPAIFRIDQYSSNASIYCTPFYITATSNIGVNTTTPSYRLHVNGTFYAAGSSIKYKEGICNYDTDSCLFMCLKPVAYQYKDEFKHLGKELKSDIQIGLIAEDVAEVMPELAVLVNEEDEKVVRNVDYEKLSIVLLAEVQKLRREVDTLKNN